MYRILQELSFEIKYIMKIMKQINDM